MSNIRLIPATLKIEFDEISKECELEYFSICKQNHDQTYEWLKRAVSRGEAGECDQVFLKLLIELHKKVDEIARKLNGETEQYITLKNSSIIDKIGFGGFCIAENKFIAKKEYYARIKIPVFPERVIAIFCEALDENNAKITKIHADDERDWDALVGTKELEMIREMKGK